MIESCTVELDEHKKLEILRTIDNLQFVESAAKKGMLALSLCLSLFVHLLNQQYRDLLTTVERALAVNSKFDVLVDYAIADTSSTRYALPTIPRDELG